MRLQQCGPGGRGTAVGVQRWGYSGVGVAAWAWLGVRRVTCSGLTDSRTEKAASASDSAAAAADAV
eukprot:5973809-Prymnesium_polylepis.1